MTSTAGRDTSFEKAYEHAILSVMKGSVDSLTHQGLGLKGLTVANMTCSHIYKLTEFARVSPLTYLFALTQLERVSITSNTFSRSASHEYARDRQLLYGLRGGEVSRYRQRGRLKNGGEGYDRRNRPLELAPEHIKCVSLPGIREIRGRLFSNTCYGDLAHHNKANESVPQTGVDLEEDGLQEWLCQHVSVIKGVSADA